MRQTGYDQDFYTWAKTQAAHIRAKAWCALDIEHVAEELESLGNEQAHELGGKDPQVREFPVW